jgi:hypothetical protein
MARQKFTHRLPEVRITEQLYRKMHNTATEQEENLTNLIRSALEQFFADDIDGPAGLANSFAVPVAGVLTEKGITFNKSPLVREHLALYLEVEPVGGGA